MKTVTCDHCKHPTSIKGKGYIEINSQGWCNYEENRQVHFCNLVCLALWLKPELQRYSTWPWPDARPKPNKDMVFEYGGKRFKWNEEKERWIDEASLKF